MGSDSLGCLSSPPVERPSIPRTLPLPKERGTSVKDGATRCLAFLLHCQHPDFVDLAGTCGTGLPNKTRAADFGERTLLRLFSPHFRQFVRAGPAVLR